MNIPFFRPLVMVALGCADFGPASAQNDLRAVFQQAQQAAFQQSSFRITADTVGAGEPIRVVIEYVKPDRIREALGEHAEIISIGAQAYMKGAHGPWQRSAAFANLAGEAKKNLIGTALLAGSQITQTGPGTLPGVPTVTYRVTRTDDGVQNTTTYWLDLHTHLPVRAELTARGHRISTTTYQYNLPLTINPPK